MDGDEPRWITRRGLLILHDRSIALHGGAPGILDEGLLESALVRPQNHFHYEGVSDLAELAATYACAIAANHPFADGNKRASYLAAGLFLEKNGVQLNADQAEAALIMISVAAGKTDVAALTTWIRTRS